MAYGHNVHTIYVHTYYVALVGEASINFIYFENLISLHDS